MLAFPCLQLTDPIWDIDIPAMTMQKFFWVALMVSSFSISVSKGDPGDRLGIPIIVTNPKTGDFDLAGVANQQNAGIKEVEDRLQISASEPSRDDGKTLQLVAKGQANDLLVPLGQFFSGHYEIQYTVRETNHFHGGRISFGHTYGGISPTNNNTRVFSHESQAAFNARVFLRAKRADQNRVFYFLQINQQEGRRGASFTASITIKGNGAINERYGSLEDGVASMIVEEVQQNNSWAKRYTVNSDLHAGADLHIEGDLLVKGFKVVADETLQAVQGLTGPSGQRGLTGDVGPIGPQGEPGISAYDEWLKLGNSGTPQEFISSLARRAPEPRIKLDFIGSTPGTDVKWRSLSKGVDGILYGAPYASNHLLEIDPSTDQVSVTLDTTAFGTGKQKWVGSITASNGKIYANPNFGNGYLVIDTNISSQSESFLTNKGRSFQVRGGAEASNRMIYSPTFSGPAPLSRIYTIDTSSGNVGRLDYTISRSAPIYSLRPDWQNENSTYFGCYDRYWGAVTARNGKIYGVPFGADRILIIDPTSHSAIQGDDLLTGNVPLPNQPLPIPRNVASQAAQHPYWQKYSGGTLSSVNGKIYALPREAKAILKIDPQTDSAIEIPLPLELQDTGNASKSFSSVEGPDGRIYSVPWQAPYLFWINPANDEVGYIDISAELQVNLEVPGNYYTYAVSVDDSIYFAPGSAQKVLKVTVR